MTDPKQSLAVARLVVLALPLVLLIGSVSS